MSTIMTRMGDGASVEMTRDDLRRDLIEGTEAAAKKGKIPTLTENELDYLEDMFASPSRIWGVERGHEAVMSKDGSVNSLCSSRLSSGVAAPIGREAAIRLFETAFAFDSMEVGHLDYSAKPCKFIATVEQEHMELLQHITILPLFYGFMPNLGLYYRPDGAFANPSDLLPLGKIDEARRTQEEALEACQQDTIWLSEKMVEVAADGINYDTVASTGDAEFLAALRACEHISKTTDMAVEIGMAAEVVLGFHGELEYDGRAARRAVAAPADEAGREGGGRDLRPGGQQQLEEVVCLERCQGCDVRQGLHRRSDHPHPPERGQRRGRGAHVRGVAHRHGDSSQCGDDRDRPRRRVVGGYR